MERRVVHFEEEQTSPTYSRIIRKARSVSLQSRGVYQIVAGDAAQITPDSIPAGRPYSLNAQKLASPAVRPWRILWATHMLSGNHPPVANSDMAINAG
jgi:hypothetical protein